MMHDGGRRPSVKDELWCKMNFGGRRPSVEDDLCGKTTFGGRRPSVEDDLRWILASTYSALRHFSLPILDHFDIFFISSHPKVERTVLTTTLSLYPSPRKQNTADGRH